MNWLTRLFTKPKPTDLESWWAEIEANLAARKAARLSGQVFCRGYTRRAR